MRRSFVLRLGWALRRTPITKAIFHEIARPKTQFSVQFQKFIYRILPRQNRTFLSRKPMISRIKALRRRFFENETSLNSVEGGSGGQIPPSAAPLNTWVEKGHLLNLQPWKEHTLPIINGAKPSGQLGLSSWSVPINDREEFAKGTRQTNSNT